MENFAHKLESVLARTPIEHVIVARLGAFMAPAKRWLFNLVHIHIRHAVPRWAIPRSTMLHDACRHPRAPHDNAAPGPGPAVLQYTGGTTGVPKGAMLSHRNLVANAEQFKAFMPNDLRPGKEVIVTAIPLYHIFALMVNFITYFSIGVDNWLVPNPRDFDSFIDVMKQSRCGVSMLVVRLEKGSGSGSPGWRSCTWRRY